MYNWQKILDQISLQNATLFPFVLSHNFSSSFSRRLLRSLQDTSRIIEDSSYFLLHKKKEDFKTSDTGSLSMVQYVSDNVGEKTFCVVTYIM